MDKRYLLIIIIIFICVINLYMISDFSDIVGSASVDIGNYTISLPEGFSLYENNIDHILIINPNSHMRVKVYSVIRPDDTYLNKFEEINSSEQYTLLSNGTINSNGNIIHCVSFQNIKDSNNVSVFYYTKENNNFQVYMSGFNYDLQKNETIEIVEKIVETTRINYKR